MESLEKEIRIDVCVLQTVFQAILWFFFQSPVVNFGFLFGGLISLGNFQMMARHCDSMRIKTGGASAKRAMGGFALRFLLLFLVVALALQSAKLNPFSLLAGLLCVQVVILGRGIFQGMVPKNG
jgi:hypothetical protein